jgi:hypothetical protein
LLILDTINLGPAFQPESLGKFLFLSHAATVGPPSPQSPLLCWYCHQCSRTPSTPSPLFWDPAPFGHHEELRELPFIKLPSPSPSGNRLHAGRHLWPSSAPDFATTGYALAPHTSMSSPPPPSTSDPRYCRHRPPVGPRHHGEPFLVSFYFPRPSPTSPPTGPHRQQPL